VLNITNNSPLYVYICASSPNISRLPPSLRSTTTELGCEVVLLEWAYLVVVVVVVVGRATSH
jgi:hypothetical protein